MYSVYVIRNPKGTLYKGYTSDLKRRIEQHNKGNEFSRYTKNKGPWVLVYSEEYEKSSEAIKREKFLKSGKGRELLKEILKRDPPEAE